MQVRYEFKEKFNSKEELEEKLYKYLDNITEMQSVDYNVALYYMEKEIAYYFLLKELEYYVKDDGIRGYFKEGIWYTIEMLISALKYYGFANLNSNFNNLFENLFKAGIKYKKLEQVRIYEANAFFDFIYSKRKVKKEIFEPYFDEIEDNILRELNINKAFDKLYEYLKNR